MVYRIYVEKKKELAHEAQSLFNDAVQLLDIPTLQDVRLLNRYDAENISKELFDRAVKPIIPTRSKPRAPRCKKETPPKNANFSVFSAIRPFAA